jgi:hypothetical protein
MKKILFLIILTVTAAVAQTPSVTITGTDGLSHSVVRLTMNVSGGYVNFRTRYIAAPGTCTGGSGGSVQLMEPAGYLTSGMRVVVGGLTPATTYQICPEVTADNVNWSSGVGTTVTTLPLPTPHPAPPIAPQTFPTAYPNTAGYTSVTVASDCSDFQSDLNTAVSAAMSHGTIINIAPGTVCGAGAPYSVGVAPDTIAFLPSAVNTSTSVINLPNHGFTEGEGIVFGTSYSAMPASTSCIDGTGFAEQGIINGEEYYAHVIDANNIQVYCQTSMPGVKGSLMTFTTQGSGPALYVRPWNNPNLNWVIVRTSTPDGQFAPAGTRVTPAWQSKMAVFSKPPALQDNGSVALMFVGASDGNVQYPVANIRFVGIEWTYTETTDTATSNDPAPWRTLLDTFTVAQNIIFDRNYFHMLPAPNRTFAGLYWEGSNMAIVDSYFDNLTYWHPAYTGHGAAIQGGTQVTISPGTYYEAPAHTYSLSSTETVTFGGTVSGNFLTYWDFSGNFTVAVPPSITASCSGPVSCTVVNLSSSPTIGTCNTSTPAFPRNASGNIAAGPIVCGVITNGSVTSLVQGDGTSSNFDAEGCSFMVGGIGPGPYIFQDNYLEGAGLTWHHDDSGGDTWHRGDFTYYRNYFLAQFTHMYQSPVSDGFRYFHRHMLEWKSGDRIDLNGNVFDGCWSEDTPVGDCFETASIDWVTRDVYVHNNTFEHTPAGFGPPGIIPGNTPEGQPSPREKIYNNLFWDVNTRYYSPCCQLGGKGWILANGGIGDEDLIFDHNTVVQNTGALPSLWYVVDSRREGVQITNNFLYLSVGDWGFETDDTGCPNAQGKATADCLFTSPYRFDHNVLLSNGTQAAVQAVWPNTLYNYIPSNPSNIAAVGWFNYDGSPLPFVNGNPKNYNFRLQSSLYCSGCGSPGSDGRDVGADIDALEAAQGVVSLVGVPASTVTSSSATVAFVAPDAMGCTVDYSSTDPALVNNFTRVANSGGARAQNVVLSGLTTSTNYYYRVNCAVQQPTGQFRTR